MRYTIPPIAFPVCIPTRIDIFNAESLGILNVLIAATNLVARVTTSFAWRSPFATGRPEPKKQWWISRRHNLIIRQKSISSGNYMFKVNDRSTKQAVKYLQT